MKASIGIMLFLYISQMAMAAAVNRPQQEKFHHGTSVHKMSSHRGAPTPCDAAPRSITGPRCISLPNGNALLGPGAGTTVTSRKSAAPGARASGTTGGGR